MGYPPRQISITTRRNEPQHFLNFDDDDATSDTAAVTVHGMRIPPSPRNRRILPQLSPRREPLNLPAFQSSHVRTRRTSRGDSPYPIRSSSPNTTTTVSSFADSSDGHIIQSRSTNSFPRDELEMLRQRCSCPRSPTLLVTPNHDFLVDNKCIISPAFGRSTAQNNSISIVKQKCPICLESLISTSPSKEIGATVPCGHLFHVECFQKWHLYNKNSSTRQTDHHCNCPTCNKETVDFIRLYPDSETVNPEKYGEEGRKSISRDDNDDLELYKVKAERNQLKKEKERLQKEDAKHKRELNQLKLELNIMKREMNEPDLRMKITETFVTAKNGINYMLKCISRGCRRSSHHSNSHDILSVLSFDDDYDFSEVLSDDDETGTISLDDQDESLLVPTLLF